MEFRQVSGLRKSVYHILTDAQINSLKADIAAINADVSVFRFNEGPCTCYIDDADTIFVKGDVLPDDVYSIHPRDMMSARAVLAHEYYGHRACRGTLLEQQAWNDEFRASYRAAGVTIKWNNFMRRIVYGSDYHQG